jgi:outer membrane lipoprotein-sorting protein
MKKIFAFTAVMAALLVTTVKAQTADEIISKYAETVGSVANWEKVKGVKISGTMSQMGMEFNFTQIMLNPNLQKTVISLMGKEIVMAFDGKEGWKIDPFQGTGKPEKSSEAENKGMAEPDGITPDLLFYKSKNSTITLKGIEKYEGVDAYKIVLTKSDKTEETYFLDKETYLPLVRKVISTEENSKGMEIEMVFSDYRVVGDVLMPFVTTQKANGQVLITITIKEVVLNPEVPADTFAFPK